MIAIERACGSGSVIRDPSLLEGYAHDESEVEPCMPEAVVRATSTADVSAVMKAAYEHEVPVTPRGERRFTTCCPRGSSESIPSADLIATARD